MVTTKVAVPGREAPVKSKDAAMEDQDVSPVVLVVSKRLRNARKKLGRIGELETSGKALTPDQVRRLVC